MIEPPPPARRARSPVLTCMFASRTTSACAESTLCSTPRWTSTSNHLRLRGEHSADVPELSYLDEPPPPARRARPLSYARTTKARTTSACAESTTAGRASSRGQSNHLRLHGEHLRGGIRLTQQVEPPPPARRARVVGARVVQKFRTTSACAESTCQCPGPWRGPANHLRLRGEHSAFSQPTPLIVEPPPPARRARRQPLDVHPARRTTSACAESTIMAATPDPPAANHLRLRGEHSMSRTSAMVRDEPPPPARRALLWWTWKVLP